MKTKSNIRVEVLLVLKEYLGKQKTHLRIVRWWVDEKPTKVKIEKRNFFKKKDETFSDMGTAKGFDKEDIEYIIAEWPEIKQFFD